MGVAYGKQRRKERCIKEVGGNTKVKRQLDRPRRKQEYNSKIDLKQICWEGADRIDLAYDGDKWRGVLYTVMNILIPQGAGNSLTN